MAKVNVCNVLVLDNPSSFMNPFQFEITFECYDNLPHDLEWKLTYVGSAETDALDQVLDTVLVGPVPEGRHKFVFQANSPDIGRLPNSETDVTVILLSCAYRDKEFIKIGYFVVNEYEDPTVRENPPDKPQYHLMQRRVVADEARVTRFLIPWDDSEASNLSSSDTKATEVEMPPLGDAEIPQESKTSDADVSPVLEA